MRWKETNLSVFTEAVIQKKSTRGQPKECYRYHQAISTGDVSYLDTSCLDIFADHDVCHQKNQQQYKSASYFFDSIGAQVLGEAVHMVLRDWGKIKTSIINTLILLINVYQELKSSLICSEKKKCEFTIDKKLSLSESVSFNTV